MNTYVKAVKQRLQNFGKKNQKTSPTTEQNQTETPKLAGFYVSTVKNHTCQECKEVGRKEDYCEMMTKQPRNVISHVN